MPAVILDTDFLSSFLKIGRLDLVRVFYGVDVIWITPAVHREIAQTELLTLFVSIPWLQVMRPDRTLSDELLGDEEFQGLGTGEQESIVLALSRPDAVLMVSDNKARRMAMQLGVVAINIPAFLLACRMAGLVEQGELAGIVQELRDKDFYEFRRDVLEILLG